MSQHSGCLPEICKICRDTRYVAHMSPTLPTKTGSAAALIQGGTHYRALQLPVGKALFKASSATEETNATKAKATRRRLSNVVAYFTNEHSMMGRLMFAWIACRYQELRKSIHVTNEDNVILHSNDNGVPANLGVHTGGFSKCTVLVIILNYPPLQ